MPTSRRASSHHLPLGLLQLRGGGCQSARKSLRDHPGRRHRLDRHVAHPRCPVRDRHHSDRFQKPHHDRKLTAERRTAKLARCSYETTLTNSATSCSTATTWSVSSITRCGTAGIGSCTPNSRSGTSDQVPAPSSFGGPWMIYGSNAPRSYRPVRLWGVGSSATRTIKIWSTMRPFASSSGVDKPADVGLPASPHSTQWAGRSERLVHTCPTICCRSPNLGPARAARNAWPLGVTIGCISGSVRAAGMWVVVTIHRANMAPHTPGRPITR